jgi:uncharacterized protein YecE (DUF72 family)
VHETLPLFEPADLPLKAQLAPNLKRLAESNLFIGTSSWKYEGWLGSLYSPERYSSRGRFSKSRFERECLKEYAEVFQIVSGDFAFYQFPTPAFWRDLFAQVQAPFKFAFKAPEDITAPIFPKHNRYGARAGQINPLFLDSVAFTRQFLDILRTYSERVALIMFEFPASAATAFATIQQFADSLARFLGNLPSGFRYGVEIRNPMLLTSEYFHALREQGVAHVFNSWTDMPSVTEQMSFSEAFTGDFAACRALMRPGRSHEKSVSMFTPYTSVREPNWEVRKALRELLVRGRQRSEPVFVFINNRLEGFAPGTIASVVDQL